MSYARKYIKLMVFDIVLTDEDNDGQGMPDYITQDQSLTICDLLAACGVSQSDENFLAWAAAKSVATITKSNYAKVINGLKKKLTEAK
jgi:hypothetical protein